MVMAIETPRDIWLVGGLEHGSYFSIYGNITIPTDELHHFSEGWRKTTNQLGIYIVKSFVNGGFSENFIITRG
jgi:hypothetical protein